MTTTLKPVDAVIVGVGAAGTIIAKALAPRVDRVDALDPSAAMLATKALSSASLSATAWAAFPSPI